MFVSLSNKKKITAPRPKKPMANPNPEAKTGVYSLFGAVVYNKYAIKRLTKSVEQNTSEAQNNHFQTNSFILLPQITNKKFIP